jgi:hypothetical protein
LISLELLLILTSIQVELLSRRDTLSHLVILIVIIVSPLILVGLLLLALVAPSVSILLLVLLATKGKGSLLQAGTLVISIHIISCPWHSYLILLLWLLLLLLTPTICHNLN